MDGDVALTAARFFSGWDIYQAKLAKVIAPLDAAQLDLQAAPHLWSVRMLANHVISTRAWWFNAWMGEGGPDLAAMVDWDEDEAMPQRPAGEIVRGLELSWSIIAGCLGRWSSDVLDAEFVRPTPNAAGERPHHSRQWIIWHVAEHDLHHGGEVSFTLGMNRLPGIDL